jgi:hypothetical protein
MNAHGIAELRKAIRQSPDSRDLRGLNASMKEAANTSIAPALSHLLEVVIEIAKDDVAMTVD